MSALLALLADAATTILSDEECRDGNASPPSNEAASSISQAASSFYVGSAIPSCPGKVGKDRRPAKKRFVPPEVPVQARPNINAHAHHDPHETARAPNNFYARSQQPSFQPVQPNDPRCAPPMPLSILPKKKRKKKKEERRVVADTQGQYLATSWYFNESTFPVTLMAIMESQATDSPSITFLSDDQRFVIVDPCKLEKEIFPKHFDLRTPTLEEFSEMLKLWGFSESVDKLFPNVAVYTHEQFMKGDWEKCLKIEMPLASLEKLTKIQAQSAEGKDDEPQLVQTRPKRSRRGAGVPLPPAHLVAGFCIGSGTPSVASFPRRITQEMVRPSIGQLSHGHGAANAQSLLLSRFGQNHLQSILLGQPSIPQQQQQQLSLVNKNPLGGRRLTVDTNPFAQRNQYPQNSPDIASKVNDAVKAVSNAMKHGNGHDALAPPSLSREVSLPGKFSSAQLDAMTEHFLARSSARLKSRPVGIRGPADVSERHPFQSPSLPIGSANGAHPGQLQLELLLAARQRLGNTRRISMLGVTPK